MIAVDTNLLVYAHREDSAWHEPASRVLSDLAQGASTWAIPWPCIHEFLAIVTHPRIYSPPSTIAEALDQVEAWLESPALVLIAEGPGYFEALQEALTRSKVVGGAVHDARVAAICAIHGVTSLYTADRDFSRFPALRCVNPL